MITINSLTLGDVCPCGDGRLIFIDLKRDFFRCWSSSPFGVGPGTQTDHLPLPSAGPGFYTNLTNTFVTPRSVAGQAVMASSTRQCLRCVKTPAVRPDGTIFCCGEVQRGGVVVTLPDRTRYPNECTRCGAPAYVGVTPAALDCSRGCEKRMVTR